MELEGLLKPNVSEQLAIDLARRLYGLEVLNIKRMVSFDDQNFHIQVSKEYKNQHIAQVLDDGYNLKITNVNRSAVLGHFDSMHATMIHLNEKGLPVPVPVKRVDGCTWRLEKVPLLNEEANLEGDKQCGIHLLTYIPGIPISKVSYTSDLLYHWGLLLAKFHNAVEDFHHPALLNKQLVWNLEQIPDIRNYMEGLDGEKEKLVTRVLARYPDEITKNIEKLPKGFIHGDFNENNVLVVLGDDGSGKVNGILDFEDVHYGTYVWDLGLMLAYTLLDCKTMDPLDGAGHALAGYLSLRPLSGLEVSLIKICIECRLCQSLVLCGYSYRSDPNNSYLLTSAKTGWNRLEQISNTKNEDLQQRWREIQAQHNARGWTRVDATKAVAILEMLVLVGTK